MLEIQTSNLHSVLNDYIWIQIKSCILSSNLSVTRAKHKKEKVQARDTSKFILLRHSMLIYNFTKKADQVQNQDDYCAPMFYIS